jgi:hypothetical protein
MTVSPSPSDFKDAANWATEAAKYRQGLVRIAKRGLNKPEAIHRYLTTLEWAYPSRPSMLEADRRMNLDAKHKAHVRIYNYLRRHPKLISDFMLNIMCALENNPSQELAEIVNMAARKNPQAFTFASLKQAADRVPLQPHVNTILRSNPGLVHAASEKEPEKRLLGNIFRHIVHAPDNATRQVYRVGALEAIREYAPESITGERMVEFIDAMKDKFGTEPSTGLSECLQIAVVDILTGRNDLLIAWKKHAPKEWNAIVPARASFSAPIKRAALKTRSAMRQSAKPLRIHAAQRPKRSRPALGGKGPSKVSPRGRHLG